MSVTDPIADFLTCIRNACKAKKETIAIPSSNVKESIAKILKDEGFIKNYKVIEEGNKKVIHIYLKYLKGRISAIKKIKRISKPGLRRYTEAAHIPRVLSGLGVVVLSTSQGAITGEEARRGNIGGEIICTIS